MKCVTGTAIRILVEGLRAGGVGITGVEGAMGVVTPIHHTEAEAALQSAGLQGIVLVAAIAVILPLLTHAIDLTAAAGPLPASEYYNILLLVSKWYLLHLSKSAHDHEQKFLPLWT